MSLDFATKTPTETRPHDIALESTTDSPDESKAALEAVANGGPIPVRYEIPDTEVDDKGQTTTAWEHESSSRRQFERLQELEAAAAKEELESLQGLNPAAEAARQETLAAMEQGQQEGEEVAEGTTDEAQPLTEAELAQIRQQAVQDAIRAGRRAAGFDAQVLEAEYMSTQQQVLADYSAKLEAARARHSDWDATFEQVKQNGDIALSPAVTEALLSIGGPEVSYYLAKHPAEASKLAAMPEHVAVARVGQLAAQVNSPRSQPARQRTSSLGPTPPVGGTVRSTKSPDEMSYSEYCTWRNKNKSFRR